MQRIRPGWRRITWISSQRVFELSQYCSGSKHKPLETSFLEFGCWISLVSSLASIKYHPTCPDQSVCKCLPCSSSVPWILPVIFEVRLFLLFLFGSHILIFFFLLCLHYSTFVSRRFLSVHLSFVWEYPSNHSSRPSQWLKDKTRSSSAAPPFGSVFPQRRLG